MFIKRALAIVAVAAMAASGLAQEVKPRELAMNTVKHGNAGPENYLWPGPKTIRDANGIVQLAVRWSNALQKGWRGLGGAVDSSYVLAQYAPDGAISFKSKPDSGLATGSTLLPTVSGVRATTTALKKAYFDNTFLPIDPVPIFDPATLQFRVLSKDVVTATGNWNYNTSSSGDFPREARVLVVWKKYPKITISTPNGQVTSRNHWLIVEMHSSPRVCTGGTTCTVVPIIP